jgi:REP element-mobilizing transposase RayT
MAKYDPDKHHRRSIRLKNYDYASAGVYFVTICVQHRQPLFGKIVAQSMQLNEAGQMIESVWQLLPERFPHIEMDEFVVMPNHFHGILVIHNRAGLVPAPTTNIGPTLGDMVGAFKSITTHQYIQGVRKKDWPPFDGHLWQRNYWEHIIRNKGSLLRLREYVQSNPITWNQDSLHPNSNPKKG